MSGWQFDERDQSWKLYTDGVVIFEVSAAFVGHTGKSPQELYGRARGIIR